MHYSTLGDRKVISVDQNVLTLTKNKTNYKQPSSINSTIYCRYRTLMFSSDESDSGSTLVPERRWSAPTATSALPSHRESAPGADASSVSDSGDNLSLNNSTLVSLRRSAPTSTSTSAPQRKSAPLADASSDSTVEIRQVTPMKQYFQVYILQKR